MGECVQKLHERDRADILDLLERNSDARLTLVLDRFVVDSTKIGTKRLDSLLVESEFFLTVYRQGL